MLCEESDIWSTSANTRKTETSESGYFHGALSVETHYIHIRTVFGELYTSIIAPRGDKDAVNVIIVEERFF